MAGISFTAIDFETANSNPGSVCAVGLVKVRDGKVVDKSHWLIKPPPGIDHFDPINVEVHGIRERDVVHAADWEMSIEGILQFACEDQLVAYDAPYDASVMRKATEQLQLDLPAKDFYCAQELARTELELPKHNLNDVLEALKLPPVRHHEPGTNALACANVVLTIAALRQFASLAEIWGGPTASIGQRRQGRRVRDEESDAEGEATDADARDGEAPDGEARYGVAPDGEAPAAVGPADAVRPAEAQTAPNPAPRAEATPTPAPARPGGRRGARSGVKSGLALLAAGLLAAFFLSALSGLAIQSFSAGHVGTGAVEAALAVAAAWGVWASITAGWRRIWSAR
jgi:DNA polymerase III epsilon subunit-like protein